MISSRIAKGRLQLQQRAVWLWSEREGKFGHGVGLILA
jgi:hypothetical protein